MRGRQRSAAAAALRGHRTHLDGERYRVYGSPSCPSMSATSTRAASKLECRAFIFVCRSVHQSTPLNVRSLNDLSTTRHASAISCCSSSRTAAVAAVGANAIRPPASAATHVGAAAASARAAERTGLGSTAPWSRRDVVEGARVENGRGGPDRAK